MQRFSQFIVTGILLLTAVTRSQASGGSECDDMSCSSFFTPEIIENPVERPFFRSQTTLYQPISRVTEPTPDIQTVNLDEWSVGSSRVDLQACKLEYSIVSPK